MKRLHRVFQLDLASGDFTEPVFSDKLDDDKVPVVPSLDSNTQYKWRCKDILVSGLETKWSEIQFFTTKIRPDFIILDTFYVGTAHDSINDLGWGFYDGIYKNGYYYQTLTDSTYSRINSYDNIKEVFGTSLDTVYITDGATYLTHGMLLTTVSSSDHLFVWARSNVLTSVDISDPTNMVVTQNLVDTDLDGLSIKGLDAVSSSDILLMFGGKFITVDVSDPANMQILSVCSTDGNGTALGDWDLVGMIVDPDASRVYASSYDGVLHILDISDLSDISIIKSTQITGSLDNLGYVALDKVNRVVYMSPVNSYTVGGIYSVDVIYDTSNKLDEYVYAGETGGHETSEPIVLGGSLILPGEFGEVYEYNIQDPTDITYIKTNTIPTNEPYGTVYDPVDNVIAMTGAVSAASICVYENVFKITGEDEPHVGATYTVSGGTGPFVFTFDSGTISTTATTATILTIDPCVSGEIIVGIMAVTDANDRVVSMVVRLPGGSWVYDHTTFVNSGISVTTGDTYDWEDEEVLWNSTCCMAIYTWGVEPIRCRYEDDTWGEARYLMSNGMSRFDRYSNQYDSLCAAAWNTCALCSLSGVARLAAAKECYEAHSDVPDLDISNIAPNASDSPAEYIHDNNGYWRLIDRVYYKWACP